MEQRWLHMGHDGPCCGGGDGCGEAPAGDGATGEGVGEKRSGGRRSSSLRGGWVSGVAAPSSPMHAATGESASLPIAASSAPDVDEVASCASARVRRRDRVPCWWSAAWSSSGSRRRLGWRRLEGVDQARPGLSNSERQGSRVEACDDGPGDEGDAVPLTRGSLPVDITACRLFTKTIDGVPGGIPGGVSLH